MNETTDSYTYNYYDYDRGWDETNKGWYQIIMNGTGPVKHYEMVKWMYTSMDNPERHARWIRWKYGSGFKFRYERDYIMFTLRWS